MKYTCALLVLNSLFVVGLQPQTATAKTLYSGSGFPQNETPQWLIGRGINSSREIITPDLSLDPITNSVVVKTENIDDSSPTAGYFGYTNQIPSIFTTSGLSLLNSKFPVLNADAGYSIFFEVALTESFPEEDLNRAPFSVVAISSDVTKGIELDFEEDLIFAQSDTLDPITKFSEFTRAETSDPSADIDLTISNGYELRISEDGYELFINEDTTPLLTGDLRNYEFDIFATDPSLPFNPYEAPNFLYFGDLSDRAAGTFTLGEIRVETATATPESNFALALALIGIGFTSNRLYKSRK